MSQRIFPITMPKWGIEMQEGTITAWNAAAGQIIAKGDALLDVETEKIVNSVEAPVSGTLRRILADVGGDRSRRCADRCRRRHGGRGCGDRRLHRQLQARRHELRTGCRQRASASERGPDAFAAGRTDRRQRVRWWRGETRVSPIARRLAEKLGIDVSRIKGTGTHGRVSKEDVEAYAAPCSKRRRRVGNRSVPAATSSAAPTREKMTSMRATIARRLLESKQSIPHYRLSVDVDLTALLAPPRAD